MEKPSGASAERRSAFFLSPEPPYPLAGGGHLRSASVLEYLQRRYRVDAIFFQPAGSPDPRDSLPAGRVERAETIWLPHHSKDPLARATRNALRLVRQRPPLVDRFSGFGEPVSQFVAGRQYDLAVIEHFWCAPYVMQLRGCSKTICLNLHNVESAWHESLARSASGLHSYAHRSFARACAALEKRLLPRFDCLLVTSDEDAARIRQISPVANVVVYPNALPSVSRVARHEDDAIAFSGNLAYEPNRAAVRYFKASIWPLLRDRWPDVEWRIIGKNAEAVSGIVAGDPRIRLTGAIDDAVASLARAKVAVVPVLAGSGTRMKILEAWAAATPVVSTTLGAEGLICQPSRHLFIADTPAQFAERVSELLGSPEKRVQMGEAAQTLCEQRYTWDAAWRILESALGLSP